jgi:phosphoribosylformylglycinamidine synthase
MTARVGIVVFPGTNCEHDVADAVCRVGGQPELLWHADASISGVDAVVLPGGFAHGDYLRTGAIARFSPVMSGVAELARAGGPVLGICNGFQVLCEAGLLPGALRRNAGLRFLCQMVRVDVVSTSNVLASRCEVGDRLELPINHFEGNYAVDHATAAAMVERGQVVLRYVDNPNGAMLDAAGVCNEAGNVVGLMPHPERASHELLGSTDGSRLFAGLLAAA